MVFNNQNKLLRILETEYHTRPQARLTDLYKLAFQASYGQGHYSLGRQAAITAIESELSMMGEHYYPLLQDISLDNVMYRVSISCLRLGLISWEDYLEQFLTTQNIQTDWGDWSELWPELQAKLIKTYPCLDVQAEIDLCRESMRQKQLLSHSESFRLTYRPHYRVMSITQGQYMKISNAGDQS